MVRKEKKRKDYAFPRQFIEKPSIIPGCPVSVHGYWYDLSAAEAESALVAGKCLLAVVACMYNNSLSACYTECRRQAKANEASTGYRHSSSAQPMEERS